MANGVKFMLLIALIMLGHVQAQSSESNAEAAGTDPQSSNPADVPLEEEKGNDSLLGLVCLIVMAVITIVGTQIWFKGDISQNNKPVPAWKTPAPKVFMKANAAIISVEDASSETQTEPDPKGGVQAKVAKDATNVQSKQEKEKEPADEKAKQEKKKEAGKLLAQGMAAMQNQKWEEAIKFLEASVGLDDASATLYHLGKANVIMGRLKHACGALSRAIEVSNPKQTKPSQFDILFTLGSTFKMIGPNALPHCVRAFGDASRLNPTHADCKKQFEEAQKLLAQHGGQTPPTPGQPQKLKVTLPPDAKPGAVLNLRLPNGQTTQLKLPPNAKPGDTIEIQMTPPPNQDMKVSIPMDIKGGDEIVVQGPNGEGDTITLGAPPNAKGGDMVKLSRPCKSPDEIHSGMVVKLTGLSGDDLAKLNGEKAMVTVWDTKLVRWIVQLENGAQVPVEKSNLELQK